MDEIVLKARYGAALRVWRETLGDLWDVAVRSESHETLLGTSSLRQLRRHLGAMLAEELASRGGSGPPRTEPHPILMLGGRHAVVYCEHDGDDVVVTFRDSDGTTIPGRLVLSRAELEDWAHEVASWDLAAADYPLRTWQEP